MRPHRFVNFKISSVMKKMQRKTCLGFAHFNISWIFEGLRPKKGKSLFHFSKIVNEYHNDKNLKKEAAIRYAFNFQSRAENGVLFS
jgi:hypothetical protein